MRDLGHTSTWFFFNLVWCDICNSVLPTTSKKAAEQAQLKAAGRQETEYTEQEFSIEYVEPEYLELEINPAIEYVEPEY